MKWLACNRVPSPPTVITRSTSRMGCDRSLRTRAFHSTGLRRKIFWQKFIASLCTFCLLSKCCSWRNQFKINCISWKKVPQPRHILQNRYCDLKFVSYTIIKPKLLWGKNLEYLKCHHLFLGMKYTYLLDWTSEIKFTYLPWTHENLTIYAILKQNILISTAKNFTFLTSKASLISTSISSSGIHSFTKQNKIKQTIVQKKKKKKKQTD